MRLIKGSRCIPLSPCGWAERTEAVELPQLKAADFTRRILALSESLLLRCAHLWWRPPCARRLLDTVILAVHDRAQCSCHGAPETPHRLLGWTCTLCWHAVPIFVLIAAASLLDLHVCALTVARTSFETRAGRKAGRHISGILHARHGCSVRTLLRREMPVWPSCLCAIHTHCACAAPRLASRRFARPCVASLVSSFITPPPLLRIVFRSTHTIAVLLVHALSTGLRLFPVCTRHPAATSALSALALRMPSRSTFADIVCRYLTK